MHLRTVLGLPLAVVLAGSCATAADMPTGESLLKRFIERTGGEAAYTNAKTAVMEGTVEVVGRNISGHVSMVEEGEKSWTAMDLAGIGRIEQGYDGDTAWEMSAIQGPRILEGEEKAAIRRGSSLALPKLWQYKAVRTVGSEDVDGKPAWKVEMTPKEGRPEFYDFDKDSGLMVRMSTVMATPLGDISTSAGFSDYRQADGILTAFTMTQEAMGQTIAMHFESVKYNAPLPKDRFDLPPDIKALAAKQKQ